MSLIDRIGKFKYTKYQTNTSTDFDYQKALGEKEFMRIKQIVDRECYEAYQVRLDRLAKPAERGEHGV